MAIEQKISYGQNHEDVLLYRVFNSVERGFYIDVGANDPIEDSVTKLLYDLGWHGINVEPKFENYKSLVEARPNDINLNCAAGSKKGEVKFYDNNIRGWSTTDAEVGERYVSESLAIVQIVEMRTLNDIIKEFSPSEIHFLKIDVEGAEEDVLLGLDLSIHRPWVLVIESIDPITNESMHHLWESNLIENNYAFMLFDGLNRFYLANEHISLSNYFKSPVNVLDQFIPYSLHKVMRHNEVLQDSLHKVNAHNEELQGKLRKLQALEDQVELLISQLNSVYSSTSWKLTKPVRWCGTLFIKGSFLNLLPKQHVNFPLIFKMYFVRTLKKANAGLLSFPKIRKLVVKAISISPFLKFKIIRLLSSSSQIQKIAIASIKRVNDFSLQARHETIVPAKRGDRVLYVYVDHTINCNTNTGVQRVVRSLSASLLSTGEIVKFVKWEPTTKQCLLINTDELDHLGRWSGPTLSTEERLGYPSAAEPQIPISTADLEAGNWLIVPEVTHITTHDAAPTLDLIMWAKQSGLRTGFVFYDAIPIKREEFADIAGRHAQYMTELLHADVVFPISDFAKDDLLSYWVGYDKADQITLPLVNTLPLSGELQVSRCLNPVVCENKILSVGTIEPRKNQLNLVKAFDRYIKLNPTSDWQLILVGNLHPNSADEFNEIINKNSSIKHLGHVSEKKLDSLYESCKFTVFPSVEEGFGLPILESLWYGKPCICANFGSMQEVAAGGGCYTLDTKDVGAIFEGLSTLINNNNLLLKLQDEAIKRNIPTWSEYADSLSNELDAFSGFANKIGLVYYWIDATISFPKNTGIQRVSRQLARAMMEEGAALIPIKWDQDSETFVHVIEDELAFFEQWNGPSVSSWHAWIKPDCAPKGSWFFMPDLPLNRTPEQRQHLLEHCSKYQLKTASIFYDAIPWKMRDIYPEHFANAHFHYMKQLNLYDLVLPISHFTQQDLIDFLGAEIEKPQSLEHKIKAVPLPAEFSEVERVTKALSQSNDEVNILVVGTVEPRKNHEVLLKAFKTLSEDPALKITLTLAGRDAIVPEYSDRIRAYVNGSTKINWEENSDDARLSELYQQCDFTVYPSIEEGFGLPILESLWYGKPCVCANFGSMSEVADGGGCVTVDVRDKDALVEKMRLLIEDGPLRARLSEQAIARNFKTWNIYSLQVLAEMAKVTGEMVKPVLTTPDESQNLSFIANTALKPRPKLSVCISTYNRAKWLEVSLKNWALLYPEPMEGVEFFVCDNTSTDNTSEIVKPYIARSDFSYHRNVANVGMLGNLRETANRANGEYVWILGDDDLIKPGAINKILNIINNHEKLALIYLNYAYTHIEDATTIRDFTQFFNTSTPIVPAEADQVGELKAICARNENFFTAIYTLVFRRDHALKAYSQNTNGRPFSTMLTSIPTSHYVLNHMMNESAYWVGEPQLVVNMNVSWMKYASIWILERVPELYELAELKGVDPKSIDRWRVHTLNGILYYFNEIYNNDPLGNVDYFSPSKLVRRFKHLEEFKVMVPELKKIYRAAWANNPERAKMTEEEVFGAL